MLLFVHLQIPLVTKTFVTSVTHIFVLASVLLFMHLNSFLWLNLLPQLLHIYGCLSACVCLCIFSPFLWLNLLPQKSHLYGCFSACFCLCTLKTTYVTKLLSQYSQLWSQLWSQLRVAAEPMLYIQPAVPACTQLPSRRLPLVHTGNKQHFFSNVSEMNYSQPESQFMFIFSAFWQLFVKKIAHFFSFKMCFLEVAVKKIKKIYKFSFLHFFVFLLRTMTFFGSFLPPKKCVQF